MLQSKKLMDSRKGGGFIVTILCIVTVIFVGSVAVQKAKLASEVLAKTQEQNAVEVTSKMQSVIATTTKISSNIHHETQTEALITQIRTAKSHSGVHTTKMTAIKVENDVQAEIEAKKEAEAKKQAEESAAKKAKAKRATQKSAKSEKPQSESVQANVSNSSGSGLTRSGGVYYYNGHKETWYSERVLPGGALDIPGRCTDDSGLVRDEEGYICVASPDYPKGTVVETSLGTGKVYDSGCASGVIDIYTNW